MLEFLIIPSEFEKFLIKRFRSFFFCCRNKSGLREKEREEAWRTTSTVVRIRTGGRRRSPSRTTTRRQTARRKLGGRPPGRTETSMTWNRSWTSITTRLLWMNCSKGIYSNCPDNPLPLGASDHSPGRSPAVPRWPDWHVPRFLRGSARTRTSGSPPRRRGRSSNGTDRTPWRPRRQRRNGWSSASSCSADSPSCSGSAPFSASSPTVFW